MSMPQQGTPTEIEIAALTNHQIAGALSSISYSPRYLSREWRDAILHEAEKRLRWPNVYDKHR